MDAKRDAKRRVLKLGSRQLLWRIVAGAVVAVVWSSWLDATWFIVPFVVGMAAVVVQRQRVVIDVERRVVRAPSGFLGWQPRVVPVDALRVVYVVKSERLGQASSVVLAGRNHVVRSNALPLAEAMAQATRAATVLGLEFRDGDQRFESGFVDEALRERLVRTGTAPGQPAVEQATPFRDARTVLHPPEAPPGSSIRLDVDGEQLRMRAPISRRLAWSALGIGVAAMFVGRVGVDAVARLDEAQASTLMLVAILLLVPVPLVGWLALARGFDLRVDRRALTVRAWGRLPYRVPLTQLSDLFVVDPSDSRHGFWSGPAGSGRLVVRRTDGSQRVFGSGQSRADLQWVVDRVKHRLATA